MGAQAVPTGCAVFEFEAGFAPPWAPDRPGVNDLAAAIGEDPRLSGDAGHAVIFRDGGPDAASLLAVLGVTDPALAGSVAILGHQLQTSLPDSIYIGLDEVPALVGVLADRLRRALGEAWLESCTLMAIPRGGQIVAGFLSYALDIPRRRCQAGSVSLGPGPLLVADDTAISGLRLRELLTRLGPRPVAVATLASPSPLRQAVSEAEPGVAAFVSAIDLDDRTAHFAGPAGLDGYLERWAPSEEGYWSGRVDQVVFAWSEPESTWRNPVTGRPEAGWKLVPSSGCSGNRRLADGDRPPVLAHRQPRGSLLSPAPGVLLGDAGDHTLVAAPASGGYYRLSGASHRLFWMLADADVSLEELLAGRQELDEGGTATSKHDLQQLMDGLVEAGITRSPSG